MLTNGEDGWCLLLSYYWVMKQQLCSLVYFIVLLTKQEEKNRNECMLHSLLSVCGRLHVCLSVYVCVCDGWLVGCWPSDDNVSGLDLFIVGQSLNKMNVAVCIMETLVGRPCSVTGVCPSDWRSLVLVAACWKMLYNLIWRYCFMSFCFLLVLLVFFLLFRCLKIFFCFFFFVVDPLLHCASVYFHNFNGWFYADTLTQFWTLEKFVSVSFWP